MAELHPFVSGKWRRNIPTPLPTPNRWFDTDYSFCYSPVKEIESIFLGTFPAFQVVNLVENNNNRDFFYGSRSNSFWPLLSLISGVHVTTEHEMFQLLQNSYFGVTDILRKIDRNGQSSADSALTPLIFNEIMDLKRKFKGIKNIYTTSGGKGRITNQTSVSAAKWLRDSLTSTGFTVGGFNQTGYQKQISVLLNGDLVWEFKLLVLWSPSEDANRAIKGMISKTPALNSVISALPQAFHHLAPTRKARLVQWSYLLQLNGFPLVPHLRAMINANHNLLDTLFS